MCVNTANLIKAAINHTSIQGGGTFPCHQVDHSPTNKGKGESEQETWVCCLERRTTSSESTDLESVLGLLCIVIHGYAQILFVYLSCLFICCLGDTVMQVLSLTVFMCHFSRTSTFSQSLQLFKWAIAHCPLNKPLRGYSSPSPALTPRMFLLQVKPRYLMPGCSLALGNPLCKSFKFIKWMQWSILVSHCPAADWTVCGTEWTSIMISF